MKPSTIKEKSLTGAIYHLDNGWLLVYEGNGEQDAVTAYTYDIDEADRATEALAIQQLLYDALENCLWWHNSKHDRFRITIQIEDSQLCTPAQKKISTTSKKSSSAGKRLTV